MKTNKLFKGLLCISAAFLSVCALSACDGDKNSGGGSNTQDKAHFAFSAAIESGKNELEVDDIDKIEIFDNGVDSASHTTYTYRSTNTNVATISNKGVIKAVGPGKVNFVVTNVESETQVSLTNEITVFAKTNKANGGFNYASATKAEDLDRRAKILSKLEKYAMDTHLTGITLFDNGGKIKYSSRVQLPTTNYVTGYGFGLLGEGSIEGELEGTVPAAYKSYYCTSLSQDPKKINLWTATGSQVSDLADMTTSSYWSVKLKGTTETEWYPVLAKDEIKKPILNAQGEEIGNEETATANTDPIPMEKANDTGMYRKFRIYVKTNELKYHTSTKSNKKNIFDGTAVQLDDYEFVYKLLLCGANNLIRGTEMANDTSYGIKGARLFNNNTNNEDAQSFAEVNRVWNLLKNEGKLGIKTGKDGADQDYIELELVNPIDVFTAKYTLSSSLVSPMPQAFFVGANSIAGETDSMVNSAKYYGTFNNQDNGILHNSISCGPYHVESWDQDQQIVFVRNDDWFERAKYNRYKIPGIYYRCLDTSEDTEKVYKEFTINKTLDVTSIPTSKVATETGCLETKGDSTFKLNVNSCTQAQWDKFNSELDTWKSTSIDQEWGGIKPWMSNSHFLNGLFYSINRNEFATKRGVTPSINYFSDAYMADPHSNTSYNKYSHDNGDGTFTNYHEEAIANYHSVINGKDNYGFDYDKAVQEFRMAVNQLSKNGGIVKGTEANPTIINIHIRWMYPTDINEYGKDIASYFERAFNDKNVSGGTVKLVVKQNAVSNWEDVYNVYMMKGQFDLGFGAISGNTYNPLNFLEVLKSDNASGFTLNWGEDTGKVGSKHSIVYDDKKWSFDGLWEVADHGGVVENGIKVDVVKNCSFSSIYGIGTTNPIYNLKDGFDIEIPLEFVQFTDSTGGVGTVEFAFSRLEINISKKGNTTLTCTKEGDVIKCTVDKTTAEGFVNDIIDAQKINDIDEDKRTQDQKNPFSTTTYGSDKYWTLELYYTIRINGGATSEVYCQVTQK